MPPGLLLGVYWIKYSTVHTYLFGTQENIGDWQFYIYLIFMPKNYEW